MSKLAGVYRHLAEINSDYLEYNLIVNNTFDDIPDEIKKVCSSKVLAYLIDWQVKQFLVSSRTVIEAVLEEGMIFDHKTDQFKQIK